MQDILRNTPPEKQKRKAWLLGVGVSLAFCLLMFSASGGNVDPGMILQTDPILLLASNAVFTICFFFGISAALIYYSFKINLAFFFQKLNLREAGMVFVILLSSLAVISVVGEWNLKLVFPHPAFDEWARSLEESLKVLTEHVTHFQSATHFVVALITIAVVPAVIEELLFRGIIQNLFHKALSNPHIAIWVSAIIFGVIHFQFFGVFPRIILGALFGYLYFWSGNLTAPVLAHLLNNGIGVVVYYLYQSGKMDISPEQMESAAPWPMVMISLIVMGLSLAYFRKYQQVKHG